MSGLQYRIEDFVSWANREAARQGLAGETIPDDPHGSIALGRFRRSLAWHIARQPNGLVALAIQDGHMRTAIGYDWTTEGYGSRSRGGIHNLLDLETARATADTVMDLHEGLASGGISGPAARRAIRTAATAPRFGGTPITLASARKLLKNEDAMTLQAGEPTRVQAGNVLVVAGAPRTVARVAAAEQVGAVLGRGVSAVRADPQVLDPWIVAGVISAADSRRIAGPVTSTLSGTPRTDIRRLQISVLPIEIQRLQGKAHRRLAEFEILVLQAAERSSDIARDLASGP